MQTKTETKAGPASRATLKRALSALGIETKVDAFNNLRTNLEGTQIHVLCRQRVPRAPFKAVEVRVVGLPSTSATVAPRIARRFNLITGLIARFETFGANISGSIINGSVHTFNGEAR